MAIKHNSVVTFDYTLKDDSGEVIDASDASAPLAYLHGHGNLVPGLERRLEGHEAGEHLSVQVSPAEGYGEYSKELVQRVPRRALKGIAKITVGMRLQAETKEGPRPVTVTQVAGDMVTLDANHPLAGHNLNFEIDIREVREPTEEELAHGHVHGPAVITDRDSSRCLGSTTPGVPPAPVISSPEARARIACGRPSWSDSAL